MDALDFIHNCTMNFELDLKTMTSETRLSKELTMSGCGWDEGHEWYHLLHAGKLLSEVENCLKNRSDKSRIWIEGKKHDCKYEVDGGVVAGRIEGSETEVPVK